ncbi:MAG: hypothetical protein VST68_01635 [Nitrospirota bacterium]|nr:hypothetical protein [Nitrospirota bacterium]
MKVRSDAFWTPAQTVHYNTRMTFQMIAQCRRFVILLLFALFALGTTNILANEGQPFATEIRAQTEQPDLSSLNIRLSQRPISPPQDLVKATVALTDIQAARMRVGPSPQAAILEDDHHQRVVILSTMEGGHIRAQVLTDLDLSPRIPFITACAHDRECAYDRRPVTGGLGCIAICVQQSLALNQVP